MLLALLPACDSNDDDNSNENSILNAFLGPANPGPYLVGNTSFVLEDASRELSCGQGNRRLVTEVWYPAADDAPSWPMNHITDFFLDQRDAAIEILRESGELPEGGINDFSTGSYRNAPVHPDAAPMPILIFSHGFSSNRFQNYTMSNYLASHGYLVVAPDHTCNARIAPLPEGIILFTWDNVPISLCERIVDLSFVIDVFTEQTPEMFDGRLDTAHIAFWGHSFGGLTASEQVKYEPRVSAMLQLASFGFPVVPQNLTATTMYMWGKQDKIMSLWKELHDAHITLMPRPKYELEFIDTGHFAFSDLCLFSETLAREGDGCGWGTRIGTGEPFENPDHDQMHAMINAYATAFFGAGLLGFEDLHEYLRSNHFPDAMEYNPMTQ